MAIYIKYLYVDEVRLELCVVIPRLKCLTLLSDNFENIHETLCDRSDQCHIIVGTSPFRYKDPDEETYLYRSELFTSSLLRFIWMGLLT